MSSKRNKRRPTLNPLNTAYDAFLAAETNENFAELRKGLLTLAKAVTYKVFKQERLDLADDIIGHIFVKLPTFEGKSLFSTWAYKVAKSYAITELRKERFRRERSLDGLESVLLGGEQPCQLPTTRLPDSIITSLTREERSLLVLVIASNGSLVTASRSSGINKGTLYRKWKRLRQKLKRLLQK